MFGTMRRTSILLVAAGYALSFLVVCLGTCFATAPAAAHACCEGQDGFRAAARDCCHVTPGASAGSQATAGAAEPASATFHERFRTHQPLPAHHSPASLSPSPPLVLRI